MLRIMLTVRLGPSRQLLLWSSHSLPFPLLFPNCFLKDFRVSTGEGCTLVGMHSFLLFRGSVATSLPSPGCDGSFCVSWTGLWCSVVWSCISLDATMKAFKTYLFGCARWVFCHVESFICSMRSLSCSMWDLVP